jgi:cell division protein FtsA
MHEKPVNPMPKNLMFALDIGTRNVVGVLSRREGERYIVVDHAMKPHPDRAMLDGQIHDIQKVTEIVRSVVETLEERNGYQLEQAAIAAAGRALKTARAEIEAELDVTKEIDKAETDRLEMQAIQRAQELLSEVSGEYYCVGYSVINYYLDGSIILNPLGHRGSKLSVEIIATFLPHIVVDSLYAVLQKAGLEVMNLTLEPIAAINVAIPKNLRLLNLALVDVGAGTSDIAISKDGAVVSYGMVASAGDKLTEQIAQTHLMDFNRAEALKLELSRGNMCTFSDILGMTHTVESASILAELDEKINALAHAVAEDILELNHKPPSAIFCIGGGSQIPGFTEKLAAAVGLQKERVVIKTVNQLDQVDFDCEALEGPEFITPIGIGVTAFEEREQDFIQVTVNETSIRLFNSKPLQVSDALILTGYSARKLISERGESYEITVDGEKREIKGEYGEPAKIFVNGILAALDTKIGNKDQIRIMSAEKGKQKVLHLGDVIGKSRSLRLNGHEVPVVDYIRVNGVNRTDEYKVEPGDCIETIGVKTAKALAERVELDLSAFVFIKRGAVLRGADIVEPGDELTYRKRLSGDAPVEADDEKTEAATSYTENDIENDIEDDGSLSMPAEEAVENDETFELVREPASAANAMNRQPDDSEEDGAADLADAPPYIDVLVNGSAVRIPRTKKEMVFVDVFDCIDFDLSKPKGILELKLNTERARYTDVLHTGDVIEIQWKN